MKKILFVKLSSLGDILHATPALRELKKQNPKKDIYFLVNSSCRSVIEQNSNVKEIIEADNLGTGSIIKEALKLPRLLGQLRKYKFDEVYLFHRNKNLARFIKLLKPKKIKAFADESKKAGNVEYVKFDLGEHVIRRNLRMINGIKYKKMSPKMEYFLNGNDKEILKKYKLIEKTYIVIAPGGGKNKWAEMKSKRWSIGNYNKLIKKLDEKAVLVGDEFDKIICKKIKGRKIVNLCGKLPIDETAKIIKESKLFIGNDSMTLHLAGALNVPLVGIFGPTDGKVFNPLGKNFRYFQSREKCSPCYDPTKGTKGTAYNCPHGNCMKNSEDVEKVYKLVIKFIKL